MKKNDIYKRDGGNVFAVNTAFNVQHALDLHKDYRLVLSQCNTIGETGLLKIFEILSVKPNLPNFRGRWDQNSETMDIDIFGISSDIIDNFRGEKNGYKGHHPIRTLLETRTFKVNIQLPDKNICSGLITLNINHGHATMEYITVIYSPQIA